MTTAHDEIGTRVARGGILSDADAFIDTALALTDMAHDDPEEAVQRIAGELRDLTGSRFCAIYLVEGRALRPVTVNEHGAVLGEMEKRLCPQKDLPLARSVLREGQPKSLEGYGLPLCRMGFDDEGARSYESAMLLPMVTKRKAIGLVEICDNVVRDYDAERIIVERLVKVAARAVIWAGDARRLTARELVATELMQLGDLMAQAHTLAELVRPIATNLREVLGVADCDVWQIDGQTIICLGSIDKNGWDETLVGGTFNLADTPSYAAAAASGSLRVVASRDAPGILPSELEAMIEWGYHSNLCIPLVVDQVTVGLVDIYDTRERDFAENLEFVRNVAKFLAGAFHKALVTEQLERGNRDMQVLLDISAALTSSSLYEDALAVLARKAADAFDLPVCIINEYVPELDALVNRADFDRDRGEAWDGAGTSVTLDEMPGDRVILESGEIVVEQASDPDLLEETRASMEHWGEKTCLNVPLWFKGQPVGIMMLLSTAEERRFTPREIELARAIGEMAAMAIQNARLYRSLKQKSETDKLTGLLNNRVFRRRVAEEVARARRHHVAVTLLLLDLDDLRKFSLAAGRQLANELLTTIADLIRDRLHPHVDLAAHFGGGKFALLMPHTSLQGDDAARKADELDEEGDGPHRHGAAGVAERLRGGIEALDKLPSGTRLPAKVTASVGVAEWSPGMAGAEQLLDAAEEAVGRAKKAGKNRVETAGAAG